MDTNENHAAEPAEPHFYALEQLADLAHSIRMTAQTLPGSREQMGALLNEGKKAEAFGLYQSLEYQRGLLAGFLRDTRPLLMELEHPLVQAVEPLAQELDAFQLMTPDYTKLTAVLERFAQSLPARQTVSAAVIGRLMNHVRLGHYPTDPAHVALLAQGIAFPAGIKANILDPCCGTGAALMGLTAGHDCLRCGIELDQSRAEQAQQLLDQVGFGSFFDSRVSPQSFHAVFLNPPYLSVLTEGGGRSRDEKRFLLQSIPLLAFGGLMLYIVPCYRLTGDLCQLLCDNFEQLAVYRFLDGAFQRFRQVAVLGIRCHWRNNEQLAKALYQSAAHPEALPTLDTLPPGSYLLPERALALETFRGAQFNEAELARQLARSDSFERLLHKTSLDREAKRPPLPLSIGQVGLIGGSGLINGWMDCEYPHIIKGRIVREKRISRMEMYNRQREHTGAEVHETTSNRMIFNLLTPNGFRSLA